MRGNLKWADQPEPNPSRSKRPQLRLVTNNKSNIESDTPGEKAVQSISSTTEVILVLLAQGLLVLGLFMASNIVS